MDITKAFNTINIMADPKPPTELEPAEGEAKQEVPDCPTCETFEPQAWRKSLCRNCFHALEEHAEDLLAAEAKAVAMEAAAGEKAEPGKTTAQGVSSEPRDPPKTAPKPDMKSKTKKTSTKDTQDTPHSSTSSASSSSSLSGSTGNLAAPKSAREKFLEKVSKSSEKSSASGKDLKSLSGVKSDKKGTETDSKTSSSSTLTKTSAKSSQQSSTSSSSVSAISKSGFSSSTSESSSTTSTSLSSQRVSRLKETTSLMESKLSSTKPGQSQPKSQEIRIPGVSHSSVSSKLSAFAEKTGSSGTNKKSVESRLSSKSSSELSKTSKPSSKQDTEQRESNVASKFAKFGGGKLKESPKGSTEDLRSKPSTSSHLRKESSANEPLSKTSLNLPKGSLFEKNSSNKPGSDRFSSVSSKQTKNSPLNKSDLSKGATQNKELSSKKENASSKISSNQEKSIPAEKKLAVSDKDESKSHTKHEDLSMRSTGSAKTVQNTPQAGRGERKGGEEKEEKPGSTDVTGKYHAHSTSEEKLLSPKSTSNSVSGSIESKEKDSLGSQGNVSARAGAGDDKNVVSQADGDVDPRDKHSPRTPSSQLTNSIRPGTLGVGEQTGQASASDNIKKPGNLSLDITANGNKNDGSARSTPSPLTAAVRSILDSKSKFRDKDLHPPKSPNVETAASPTKGDNKISKHGNVEDSFKLGNEEGAKTTESDGERKLKEELKKREEELHRVKSRLTEMESRVKDLETEKEEASEREKNKETEKLQDEAKKKEEKEADKRKIEIEQASHKRDLDSVKEKLGELQAKLEEKEGQCERLITDNQGLKERLQTRSQENNEETEQEKELAVLEHDLEAAEKELEETREDNRELKRQVMEMRNEMDEMTDSFRESELEEFREMQRELEMASKNCRILQFKLRKAERRNIQTEEDRANYEEKLRQLEAQFDSQDARSHIQVLEEELRVAKEVSVRLHDELDIVEDKRLKAMEETRHLTELLEHTDKRQFRMEMEIDKLRDMVCDLKQQLKEAHAGERTPNAQDSPSDRKVISSIYTRSVN